jgi:hypothetical protein
MIIIFLLLIILIIGFYQDPLRIYQIYIKYKRIRILLIVKATS